MALFGRYLVTGVLAAVVTLGVFYEMQALIASRSHEREIARPRMKVEFVRLRRDSELQLKQRTLPQKEAPPPPPPAPDVDLSDVPERFEPGDLGVVPVFEPELDLAGGPYLGAAPADTDVIPMVRVNPQYPIAAAERGIEGWVLVRFTITPSGTVKDPEVIDSHPPGVFDRAALRAIRKWKYKPKIVDGKPVERRGVTVRLKFELED
ncbi:MAG: energy transducer TonB [Candidatus Dadabacteria bacterium]|nr:MAG: energy transducer TonB [Candidatus Dadabacteria bacterium]